MSAKFFDNFGHITYNGREVVNILARPKVLKRVTQSPYAFYPFTINEGDRPDTVARNYYKDPFYSWIVYLSNEIIDPYYGWQMGQQAFQQFIAEKYGSAVYANRKVLCYRVNWDTDSSFVSASFYNALPDYLKKYWVPTFGAGGRLINYERAQVNWLSQTNYYQTLTVSGNAAFAVGDLVSTQLNGQIVSTSEISVVNATSIVIQHIQGDPSRMGQYTYASGTTLTVGEAATVANATVNASANVVVSNTSAIIVSTNATLPTGVVTITGAVSGNVTTTADMVPITTVLSADFTGNVAPLISSSFSANCIPAAELAYWEPHTAYEMEDEKNSGLKHIRLLDYAYQLQCLSDLKRLMK